MQWKTGNQTEKEMENEKCQRNLIYYLKTNQIALNDRSV